MPPEHAMRDLAPEIVRQRLLIEGRCTVAVDSAGKAESAGFDAFIPLIDSGISL